MFKALKADKALKACVVLKALKAQLVKEALWGLLAVLAREAHKVSKALRVSKAL